MRTYHEINPTKFNSCALPGSRIACIGIPAEKISSGKLNNLGQPIKNFKACFIVTTFFIISSFLFLEFFSYFDN